MPPRRGWRMVWGLLALWGDVSDLRAEAIAAELDELPLPCRYDVQPFAAASLAQSFYNHNVVDA